MSYRKDYEIGQYASLEKPIVELSNDMGGISFSAQVEHNIFLQLLSDSQLKIIEDRVKNIQENISLILSYISSKFPNVEILQLSIGGSYGYSTDSSIRDIDFNVIVKGCFFSYYDMFNIKELQQKLDIKVNKISFMIFGEENLKGKVKIDDSVLSRAFMHTDMTIREGIVMYLRNIVVWGQNFCYVPLNRDILKMRIKRQIFQASLLIRNEIGQEYGLDMQRKKAFSRIKEAGILLSDNLFDRLKWFNKKFKPDELESLCKIITSKLEEA